MNKTISQKFLNNIHAFYEERKRFFKPEIIVFSIITIAATFIFICFSVLLHPDGAKFSYHFFLEEGSITISSATSLSIACLLAYACFFMKSSLDKRQKIFFLILALALTYLALDEVMQFHEKLGEYFHNYRFMRKITHLLQIRGWNDMVVIIYGIAALPVLIYFLPKIVQLPFVAEYFTVAFICYIIHTSLDAFVEPPTTPSQIIEESMKLCTSVFLVLGLISVLIFLINKKKGVE